MTLADTLFPPECVVLYKMEGDGLFYYWNHDGEKQIVVDESVTDLIRRRIHEVHN